MASLAQLQPKGVKVVGAMAMVGKNVEEEEEQ